MTERQTHSASDIKQPLLITHAVALRHAQKEGKEAGGRERRRTAASVGGTVEPGAGGAAALQMSREQAQQLLSAVQRRIAKNRAVFEQVSAAPFSSARSYHRHALWHGSISP